MDFQDYLLRLGKRIEALRLERGVTQTELAMRIEKDRQYVYKVENGWLNITIKTQLKICEALEIDMKTLVDC